MDLYRYFHPHHCPRLRSKPLRLQELGELEQAAAELRNALKRALIRAGAAPISEIRKEYISETLNTLNSVVDSLRVLCRDHPGDDDRTMWEMLQERKNAPGWESWSKLLEQRLLSTHCYFAGPKQVSEKG